MQRKIAVSGLMLVMTGLFACMRPHNAIPADLRDAVADIPFSRSELAILAECEANVAPRGGRLSPDIADTCVGALNEGDAKPLINKYSSADPAIAAITIGRNNALIDLKRIVSTQKGKDAIIALERSWNVPNGPMPEGWRPVDCTLCDMGLGPNPEDILGWVNKYSPENRAALEYSFRSWDSLGPVRRKSLSGDKYQQTRESWTAQSRRVRYSYLGMWASEECDALAASAASMAQAPQTRKNLEVIAGILGEDLDAVGIVKPSCMKEIELALGSASSASARATGPSAEKKSNGFSAAAGQMSGLSGKSVDAQRGTLGRLFDNSASVSGSRTELSEKSPDASTAAAKPLTQKQLDELGSQMARMENGKLKGYFADVMRQTAAGRRTIAFYEAPAYARAGTNKLDFGFDSMDGAIGIWKPHTRELRLNIVAVDNFARARGLTIPQLIRDPAGKRALAAYLSPTFVHEAEHQNQMARAVANGVDWVTWGSGSGRSSPYTRALENLSNKEASEHAIEYCRKNGGPSCLAGMPPVIREDVDKFMENGLAGLDALKAPLYTRIDSYEGGAAREFRTAQLNAFQLNTLETLQRDHPDLMTEKRKRELKDLRELMNTRFKWYMLTWRETREAEREALKFRSKYSNGLAVTPPAL